MTRKRVESLDAKPWLQSELTEWVNPPDMEDIEGVQMGADTEERAQMLRGLMLLCIPPASHGEARRWRAGYIRFVVLTWLHAPDLFGNATATSLAASLGISRRAFTYHVQALELAGLAPGRGPAGEGGPLPSPGSFRRGCPS